MERYKRVNGSPDPHWVERLSHEPPVYAVRWDIRQNGTQEGAPSMSYGTNYLEAQLDHLPALEEIRTLVEEWIDREVEKLIRTGMQWNGHDVWLSVENQLNIATGFNLAVHTGGASLPVTVKMGTDSDPVYHDFTDLTRLAAFYEAMQRHIAECRSKGWLRKANIDYNLYNEYLESEEEMTDLQKAKVEKKKECLEVQSAHYRYEVDGVDVYCSAFDRDALRTKAGRGETVNMQSLTLQPDVAIAVLDGMGRMADLTLQASQDILRQIELADTVQKVKAIDASDGYPDPVSTTVTAIKGELALKAAGSAEVQAVLFARQVINSVPMTASQALERKVLFPVWGEVNAEFGKEVEAGFKLRYGDTLYEVVQAHTLSEEWQPGIETLSLYKVVEVEHAGTKDDPIPWKQGMELYEGKFYTDKEVLYKCIRNSGQAMAYDLADLVSGGYVEVATKIGGDEK